ncbi:hypothetical protein LX32DRAFT_53 [Colletotrichum zoysiae]|uniref:Uncharacterized protein n=1 Tax=Colletotrichum zoysiae TaxID=1216348 RepID=A0AAD9HVP3_9PEZI|nr:hypothetical protein LX32DRAFT_53 [Colletotrichum zoysiae]
MEESGMRSAVEGKPQRYVVVFAHKTNFQAAKNGADGCRADNNTTRHTCPHTKKASSSRFPSRIPTSHQRLQQHRPPLRILSLSGLSIQLAAVAKRRPPVLASHSAWRHTRQGAKTRKKTHAARDKGGWMDGFKKGSRSFSLYHSNSLGSRGAGLREALSPARRVPMTLRRLGRFYSLLRMSTEFTKVMYNNISTSRRWGIRGPLTWLSAGLSLPPLLPSRSAHPRPPVPTPPRLPVPTLSAKTVHTTTKGPEGVMCAKDISTWLCVGR